MPPAAFSGGEDSACMYMEWPRNGYTLSHAAIILFQVMLDAAKGAHVPPPERVRKERAPPAPPVSAHVPTSPERVRKERTRPDPPVSS